MITNDLPAWRGLRRCKHASILPHSRRHTLVFFIELLDGPPIHTDVFAGPDALELAFAGRYPAGSVWIFEMNSMSLRL